MGNANSTTVIINNNTQVISALNPNLVKSGLDEIPTGTDLNESLFTGKMKDLIKQNWATVFPNIAMSTYPVATAFLTAPAVITPDLQSPCAVTALNKIISGWQLSIKKDFATNVIASIIADLSGNSSGTCVSGSEFESSSQSTYWLAYCMVVAGCGPNGNDSFVAYAFTAITC